MRPAFDTCVALTRLDERIARSPVGAGFLERLNFADACASLWIDGELVHLEDLVLHYATRELTIARDVLRIRRRIAGQSPDGAFSADGIRSLQKTSEIGAGGADEATTTGVIRPASRSARKGRGMTPTTPKISPASTMPLSMRCSRALTLRSNEPKSPAGLRPIRWSMISTGTRMPGSMNGVACCVRPKTCRRCFRRSSASMPGTSCPCFSTPPGSAGCFPRRSSGTTASPQAPISPPSISASKPSPSIGAGIAIAKPGCWPSPTVCWRPPNSA